MQASSCRRPNVGDGMILVIAAAVALGTSRQVGELPIWLVGGSRSSEIVFYLKKWGLPWFVTLAWAALAVRLRRPRPLLRRVRRQPGAVASCMTILASIGVGLLAVGRHFWLAQFRMELMFGVASMISSFPLQPTYYLQMIVEHGGTLIAGSWIGLLLAGRFRRERGWIDTFGIAVGAAWIVTALALIALPHFSDF